jgi:hypothetical protein
MSERPHGTLLRNALSSVGAWLTTVTAILFVVMFLVDLFGLHTNPYLGIVLFLVLPAFFVLGLLLIPLGAALERRRRPRGAVPAPWPRLDFNDPRQRRRAGLIIALTAANVVIISLTAYRGVEYMDTPGFCGQVCHQAMKPEFVAHQSAPHARVACVECHVGGGASSVARSKLLGVGRVLAVAFDTYPRPIPPPLGELLPASVTCERCHWPEKLHGDRVRRVYEYANDEANTESVTTVRLHVGGGSAQLGVATGIHWHMNLSNEIEYIATDDKRQVIPYVRLKDRNGLVREYVTPGVTADELAKGERRRMDCMDCHNRPSHPIGPSAARAVDASLARGEIAKTLPFVKREAVKALETAYVNEDAAMGAIARALDDFYRGGHQQVYQSRRQEIERAVQAVQSIYRRSVFPEMRVQFGTYPNNIGHMDFPGCFRCHDEEHVSKDGRKIAQDCESCHSIE